MSTSHHNSPYLDALEVNIVIFKADGKISYANPTALKSLNLTQEKLSKICEEDLQKIIVKVNNQTYNKQPLPFSKVLKTKKALSNYLVTIFTDAKYRELSVSAAPILNDKQEVNEVLVSFRDISRELKQKEAQKILIKLLGHELKQPLSLIKAYLYYFKKYFAKEEDTKLLKYVKKIETQISVLNQMFNDITDATKYSFNIFSIHLEETDIALLLKSTVADYRTMYSHRTINLELPKKELPLLQLDPIRIRQAITNLLRNALKFSENPHPVNVKVKLTKNTVQIMVQDYGIGVSKKEQSHIFEPYYRSKKSAEIRGLGLGLALVKHIVEKHNGSITLESKPQKGSVFTITLPIK